MSQLQPIKNVLEFIKLEKCQKKGCSSQNRGQLEVVWFGKQYETKQMTCSSCYIMNDDAIKKSLPTSYNVLPIIKFNDKLLEQYKIYEQKKKSANWHPIKTKEKKAQLMSQLNNFENKLISSLSNLQLALQNFLKKVELKNKQIFTHQTMNEIIEIKQKNSFESLLSKINELVSRLNFSQVTGGLEFEKIEIRNKRLQKQKQKVRQVVEKVENILSSLLNDLRKRNELIAKI